jgi:hypothetical protein
VRSATLPACTLMSLLLVTGCSKQDSSVVATAHDSSSPTTGPTPTSTASSDTIVRGTIKAVTDSVVTLTTQTGDVRVALTTPLKVYTRAPADLARVADHVFIGVTSVPQPDGTQRATEIHVFPEELRGLGEGSRPMAAPAGGSGGTMTNGSASMTNGSASMTNGAASIKDGANGGGGRTMTVAYNGGSQTITVPPNVSVTELVVTSSKLAPGTSVVIPATKRPDGTLTTSRVMLTNARAPK